MNYKKITGRLAITFSERWKQLLAIAIAIALPPCLVFMGQKLFWDIILYTCFEMGVLFIVTAMMGKWGKWLYIILFIISLTDFGLSFGTYLASGQEVTLDTIYLIMGTNADETAEFFSFYFSPLKIIIWLAAIVLLVLLFFLRIPRSISNPLFSKIGAAAFPTAAIICLLSLNLSSLEWAFKTAPLKYLLILKDYEPLGKVAELRHDLPLTEVTAEHPRQIVIIIGESFSKSHSSIYGYNRETNPELSRLASQGNLFVFTQCQAPATLTHLAFKNILTLWNGSQQKATGKSEDIMNGLRKIFIPWSKGEDNWYDYPTFFDVFSQKYTIRWISNQNSHGVFDNVQATFASLSDTVWYAQHHPEVGSRYDEVVIPAMRSFLKNDTLPSITIVNLMGQHESFYQRYPQAWDYFKAEDYKDFPRHQRERLAEYDNATRYNDHVVASILSLYQDQCALVFYFPDHGMDLYESSTDYCGHANIRSQESCDISCQIPFFIYASDRYLEAYPHQADCIRRSLDNPFNTKNLIYALLPITGWKLADDDSQNGKALLLDNPQ